MTAGEARQTVERAKAADGEMVKPVLDAILRQVKKTAESGLSETRYQFSFAAGTEPHRQKALMEAVKANLTSRAFGYQAQLGSWPGDQRDHSPPEHYITVKW